MTPDPSGTPAAELRAAVDAAATVLLVSEPQPDGDAFGSELALRAMIGGTYGLAPSPAEARRGRGPKHVAVLNERGAPDRYSFLDDAAVARAPVAADRETPFDLAVAVDGGVERMGDDVRAIYGRALRRAYVDHHRQASQATYDVVLLDPERAATTELLAFLLDDPAWRDVPLTRALAEALYLGLLTDTGGFLYSLVSARTHTVVARLLEAGVRANLIAERVLLDVSFDDVHVKARVLARAKLSAQGRILATELTLADHDGRDPLEIAYDKIVTSLAFVRGPKVTILLREVAPTLFKVSLRSRGEVDVARLARELDTQGGGHLRAAGCTLRGPLDRVRQVVLAAVEAKLTLLDEGGTCSPV